MRRLAALALLLALGPAAAAGPETSRRAVPVTVTAAAARDLPETARSVGRVRAPRLATVAAEVAGVVAAVEARVGDAVRAGQVLVRIDETDLRLEREAARAALARVEALAGAQRRRVRRLERLVRRRQVSEDALDEARGALAALEAERGAARARLALAERRLSKARVRAPFDGRVAARLVSAGDRVAPGSPLLRLVATGREVVLPFPETLAPRLRPGLPVRLSTPAAPRGAELTIHAVRPELSEGGHAVEAIVRLPPALDWPPGATVDAEVVLAVRRGAVVVPETAVVLRPAGSVVYVIEDGRARARRVRTGLRRDGLVEIAAGLAAGETVAVDGAAFLSDGAPVRVRGRR